MKASVGDYLHTEFGLRKIVEVSGRQGDPLAGYVLENGATILDVELSQNDVAFESLKGSPAVNGISPVITEMTETAQ